MADSNTTTQTTVIYVSADTIMDGFAYGLRFPKADGAILTLRAEDRSRWLAERPVPPPYWLGSSIVVIPPSEWKLKTTRLSIPNESQEPTMSFCRSPVGVIVRGLQSRRLPQDINNAASAPMTSFKIRLLPQEQPASVANP